MHHPHVAAGAEQAGADLHQAPRIARGNELGVSGGDISQLGRQHGIRRIRLDEIVNPRRAATVLRAFEWYQLQLGYAAENGKWRIADALSMEEVTRGIVRDAPTHRSTWRRARGDKELAHIPDALRESSRPLCPGPFIGEQMSVFFHHCAAAGGVGADVFGARALERLDVGARQLPSAPQVAGMCVKSAAAPLPTCRHHLVAVRLERALGRTVGFGEQAFHDATAKQRDAGAW
jgi:hypothetical protein